MVTQLSKLLLNNNLSKFLLHKNLLSIHKNHKGQPKGFDIKNNSS